MTAELRVSDAHSDADAMAVCVADYRVVTADEALRSVDLIRGSQNAALDQCGRRALSIRIEPGSC